MPSLKHTIRFARLTFLLCMAPLLATVWSACSDSAVETASDATIRDGAHGDVSFEDVTTGDAALADASTNGMDSPFGFHPADVGPGHDFSDALRIGVRWHRPPLYAFWFVIQLDLTSRSYDFSQYDAQYAAVPEGIHILANVAPDTLHRTPHDRFIGDSYLPVDQDEYTAFVEATVERYDGDGIDDMEGLVNPIKAWQVGNEPRPDADFATLQRITYAAVKHACQDCTVLIGGVAGFPRNYISQFDNVYLPILNELAGHDVDVFDFHWYGMATGDYRIIDPADGRTVYDHIRATLQQTGFSSDLPIWITEMGTYSGDPPFTQMLNRDFPLQTERQQAQDLFKRFIYSLSLGVKKVFPAFGLMEGFVQEDSYFNHTGLIYDGRDGGDPGKGIRKLGYYTYWKMTDLLEGVNWSTISTLRQGPEAGDDHSVFIFSVKRNGRDMRIAWWDTFDESNYQPGATIPVTFTQLQGQRIRVTSVVPSCETGADVTDVTTTFHVETIDVTDQSATIELGDDPVIVEILH
ncbi:MAG: hypothetical protein J7M25_05815 [Deltaproteobacteria bacterium]|nr:hypothetical protein [Deltaproteobacteria bacterium]